MSEPSTRFFNRELSWLEFDQRVLAQAGDENLPLLERLKFLGISASNLDEFTMVRIGSLQLLARSDGHRADPAGLLPCDQLKALSVRLRELMRTQYRMLSEELEPALAKVGIRRLNPQELNQTQRRIASQVFLEEVLPIFTPIAIPHPEDLPLLQNLKLCLAVRLQPVDPEESHRIALIPFGPSRLRFVTLPADSGYCYLLAEDLIQLHIERFFPGETILECVPMRITRNADVELQEDQAFDLMAGMQEVLDARRQGDCVRLEVDRSASDELLKFLQEALDVDDDWIFRQEGPLDLSAFMRLTDLSGFEHLRDDPWPPVSSPQVDPSEVMFQTIARKDVLLYHPYESFEPVVRLIEEAADDPDVLAIKQTLYRTSARSPIVAALKRASQNGKYVTAVVELKARFDEARNIEWARDLERADVQVIYGVKSLKTHAKLCLIVRREPHGIQRYVHFGTGNYNETTSRLYSDVSLMTCDEELGSDATSFFNAVTGYSQPERFRKIDAAPLGLRDRLLEMIDGETQRRKQGQKAKILAKLNALLDERMIEALYRASQAGVRIRLNVRGICCLKPGVPGLSENITVTSVIDRFLEHSRILYFYHGGDERLFISSADWMPRNLDRRLELLVPVEDATARQKLMSILRIHLQDNVRAWRLESDGRYIPATRSATQEPIRSQEVLYRRAVEAARDPDAFSPTMFVPHRSHQDDD